MECEQQFDLVNSECGDCHDPKVVEYLTVAAGGLGRCASCGAEVAESVQAACCPEGRGCNSFGEPVICDEECKATVTAAGTLATAWRYFLMNSIKDWLRDSEERLCCGRGP
eukprot:COSAG02_NODE_10279_length_1979_cov_1.568617_2_plen_111_part_00